MREGDFDEFSRLFCRTAIEAYLYNNIVHYIRREEKNRIFGRIYFFFLRISQ